MNKPTRKIQRGSNDLFGEVSKIEGEGGSLLGVLIKIALIFSEDSHPEKWPCVTWLTGYVLIAANMDMIIACETPSNSLPNGIHITNYGSNRRKW